MSSVFVPRLFLFFTPPATPELSTLSLQTLFRSPRAVRVVVLRPPTCVEVRPPAREVARAPMLVVPRPLTWVPRSEEHTSELQSLRHLVCRLLLEKKNCAFQQCHSNQQGEEMCCG